LGSWIDFRNRGSPISNIIYLAWVGFICHFFFGGEEEGEEGDEGDEGDEVVVLVTACWRERVKCVPVFVLVFALVCVRVCDCGDVVVAN
jgi:hypothetical protein